MIVFQAPILPFFFPVPVEVSFERPSYTFSEGSGAVNVCALAVFGSHTAPITLSTSTLNFSAQGKDL